MCELFTKFEEKLDNMPRYPMLRFLYENRASFNDVKFIKDRYSKCYEEVLCDDPQVIEAYGDSLENWKDIYSDIMSGIDEYINNLTKKSCDET